MTPKAEWSLEPHVCVHCLGRIASRAVGPLVLAREYRCTVCGHSVQGDDKAVHAMCGCGIVAKSRERGKDGKYIGFRCGPNPHKRPDSPAEFVVLFGDEVAETAEIARPAKVNA